MAVKIIWSVALSFIILANVVNRYPTSVSVCFVYYWFNAVLDLSIRGEGLNGLTEFIVVSEKDSLSNITWGMSDFLRPLV
jgi:hypothetical protein